MKVKVSDIDYDTESDGVVHTDLDLPKEMILELDDDCEIEDAIADAISDQTGWCVLAFNFYFL